jgi:hypothetical protein
MPSVFDLLDDLKKRPEMFLGMTSGIAASSFEI